MLALGSLSTSIRRDQPGSRRPWQVWIAIAALLPATEAWGDAGVEQEDPQQPAAEPEDRGEQGEGEQDDEVPEEAPAPEPPPEPEPPLLVPEPVYPSPPPLPAPVVESYPPNPIASPRLRTGHQDGVLVLSNRDDHAPNPRAPAPPPGSEAARKTEPAPEATVGDTPAAVGGLADGLVTRSLRRKDTETGGGLGWVWFLVGAAVLLLVPIGLLLTRGSRPSGNSSLPPSSRISVQPPSSDPSRASAQPPSADQKR